MRNPDPGDLQSEPETTHLENYCLESPGKARATMGCGSSKDDTTIQTNMAPTLQMDGKPNAQRATTKSGFESDIRHDKESMSSHLAHMNTKSVTEVYETGHGAVLGRGACGTVCVVRRKDTGEQYAMKSVSLDGMGGASIDELRKEIEVQKSLTHPNICRLFESFEEESQLHIIMEICTGGALVSRMKSHSHGYGERAAATLVEKMLSAVVYCHHNGIVHRDIKLDNFIYENEAEESELKLIDFGFAAEARLHPLARTTEPALLCECFNRMCNVRCRERPRFS